MSANLHPLFAQALKPFVTQPLSAERLRELLQAERARMAKLLRMPFEVDMSTDPHSERMHMVQEWMVYQAVDDCIERHMTEIEASVRELIREDARS